ncbi:MAG: threonine--tRNA ligase, partial [Armatimonadetes bacterium]|nr:threonine--tRNA ligase [Armatimonadota bacterium]
RDIYWHSTAHIMAAAVVRLFPKAKPTIGPPIEDGFYYDFDVDVTFTDEDLRRIEEEMKKIIAADEPFVRQEVPRQEARRVFEEQGNKYKVELIDELPDETVSLYRTGDFVDLCRGPHIPSSGKVRVLKLLSIAGAYWRGDERNPMLQRIYGVSYPTQQQLDEHLRRLEEAQRRDHRRLGRELDLFSFHEEAGPGLVYYHPNGAMLRQLICDFALREHLRRGYKLVRTPHLIRASVWETSGHIQKGYPMYFTEVEGQRYGIKPMNCPGHILIYKTRTRSYRDLPLRFFELGTVYRHERSGVLHGLLRVRGFTQDDAHIFCTPDQLEDEIIGVLDFARYMLRVFGFEEYDIYLSTRPEQYLGTEEIWDHAEGALASALDRVGLKYQIDPGEGVFYGPKIDVKLRDALGRPWQGPTIQCDFNLPERFDLTYVGPDGKMHRPVVIHRVVLAGIERFLGAYIEHTAGNFPVWLAPVQAKVLPIADRHNDYARYVLDQLLSRDFRAELDDSSATLGHKIRDAELLKIPYMLVVGDREQQSESVAVRSRDEGDLGPMPLADFLARMEAENKPPTIQ